jgi:hypothetical protein
MAQDTAFNQQSSQHTDQRGRDLKPHRIKPWAWFLWIAFDVCLVAYTIKSTADVWPNLLWLSILGGVAVLAGSLYVSAHSYDLLDDVRKRATVGAAIMTLALIINVLLHGLISRKYSTAQEKRQEEIELQKQTADIASKQLAEMKSVLDAQTNLANANAQIERNAAIRSDADRRYYRSTGVRRGGAGASLLSGPALSNMQILKVAEVSASPADTAEEWFWYVFLGFSLELITAAVTSTWVKIATLKDLNNNGIPDEEEGYVQPRKRGFWGRVFGRGQSPAGKPQTHTAEIPENASQEEVEAYFSRKHKDAPEFTLIEYPAGSNIGYLKQDGRFICLEMPYQEAKAELARMKEQLAANPPAAVVKSRAAGANFYAPSELPERTLQTTREITSPAAPDHHPYTGSKKAARKRTAGTELSESLERPESIADFSQATARREGKEWIVFGMTLPDIPGVRYESKKRTGVIEFRKAGRGPRAGSGIGQFGKREVIRLGTLSDGERAVQVAAAIANKMAERGITADIQA